MQAYDEMIDSGVDWLGKVPANWPQQHLRYLFRQTKTIVGKSASNYELLSLTLRGVIPRSEVEGGKNPENYDTYQLVEKDDLVACLFDYDVTPRTIGRATSTGMVTGAYTVLKPTQKISTRYYNYFFLALDETKELLHLCTGLRNGLSKPTFFGLSVPKPDFETQQKIADFLDAETAKIDTLIAKQERLLELLEEKRRATITHAVTRGLNPHVELKETNIPWLGKIPSSTEVIKLKTILSLNTGGAWGNDPSGDDTDITVLRSTEQSADGGWRISQPATRQIKASEYAKTKLQIGDLVVTKSSGSELHIGKTSIVDESTKGMSYSNFMQRLRLAQGENPRFYWYLLNSNIARSQYNYFSNSTSGLANLNSGIFDNLQFAHFCYEDQCSIVERLDIEWRRLENIKQKIQTQISLLRERRTSLISHAVTGKMKITF